MAQVTIEALKALENNGGCTLKGYEYVTYKTGWQVATEGVECKTAEEAYSAIKQYRGTCGVWYSEGIYYIDKSHRVNTKREALEIGRECHQQSILGWRKMVLAYC